VDWNGDGLDDIIVGDRNGYVTYFRRTGSGIHDLTSEGWLTASSVTIDVGANSAPVVVDWNEDGLLDLLIGNELTSQGIRLYLNSGTTTNPVLTTWTYIQSSGSDINRYRCCPQVYDLNLDGKKDLIMGENNAQIYYYENTGTNAAPAFSGFEAVQSDGSPIDLYYGTRLWVNDWNEDGLPDLLVSDFDGYVYQYYSIPTGVGDQATWSIESGFAFTIAGNPTTGAFAVRLALPDAAEVSFDVFDAAGRLVYESAEGMMSPGDHVVGINPGNISAGMYFVRCTAGGYTVTERIAVIR